MRHRVRRHVDDEEVGQASQAAVHAPRAPKTPSTHSPVEDEVLGLQQSAGNQAVVQSLAGGSAPGQAPAVAEAAAAVQRQAAQAAPHSALSPEFEEAWRDRVIVPLGRVTFLIEEEGDLPVGAMRRLNQALRAILEVLEAIPRDDPNWHRVQLLGRMVSALTQTVGTRGASKSTNEELLSNMINWRYRAAELEPLIKHAPGKPGESPSEAWHELVVLPLGRAQVRLEHSPAEAVQGYMHAHEGILLTLQATPRDDPVRLRLASLSVAVQGMLDLLEMTTGIGSPDLTGRAIEAFQAAEALGARLAGKPLTAPAGAAEKGGEDEGKKPNEEPEFTWERQGGPILDRDQLERP